MATIFYSVMGEGRGHAARARAMVERLRGEHRLVLFTSHDALAFLAKEYADDTEITVHEIPGLVFHYRGAQINNVKTVREGLAFWASLGKHARQLEPRLRDEHPDLVVTDFEPLLPRAARRVGVPVLSLDHQHFLSTYDLSSLPERLQRWAWLMSWSIWAFDLRQQRTVVSAFYKPPLRAGCEDVTQVGPLLRPAVAQRAPHRGEHVLSYVRRATPDRVIKLLADLPMPVRLYGLGEREAIGSVTFRPIDEDSFLDDLAGADCVISAAGNQLMGEALHFGKPVLALPEEHHHEQCMNACFVEQLGAGEQRYLEHVTAEDLAAFLERRETYRQQLADSDETFDGGEAAAAAIEDMLTIARCVRIVLQEPGIGLMALWLLFAQTFATLYMTGLIWFVQLVHYPMFADVPEEVFVEYERIHQARTTWAVGPMMLLELFTAIALVAQRPAGVPPWVAWTGLALLVLVDGSTAAFFGPQHGRISAGFDATLHRQLVDWNWLRTFGWTARGVLLLYALRLALPGER